MSLGLKSMIWSKNITNTQGSSTMYAYPFLYYDQALNKTAIRPLSPMDRLLYGTVKPRNCLSVLFGCSLKAKEVPLLEVARGFANMELAGFQISVDPFLSVQKFKTTARKVAEMFETSAKIILRDGTKVPLDPFRARHQYVEFLNASNTPEFLMNSELLNRPLQECVGRTGVENLYGPNTLRVFEEIGYATKRRPEIVELSFKNTPYEYHNFFF